MVNSNTQLRTFGGICCFYPKMGHGVSHMRWYQFSGLTVLIPRRSHQWSRPLMQRHVLLGRCWYWLNSVIRVEMFAGEEQTRTRTVAWRNAGERQPAFPPLRIAPERCGSRRRCDNVYTEPALRQHEPTAWSGLILRLVTHTSLSAALPGLRTVPEISARSSLACWLWGSFQRWPQLRMGFRCARCSPNSFFKGSCYILHF